MEMYLHNITTHVVECCAEDGVKDVMTLKKKLTEIVLELAQVKPTEDTAKHLGRAEGLAKYMMGSIKDYELEANIQDIEDEHSKRRKDVDASK